MPRSPRHFLQLKDLDRTELEYLFRRSAQLKERQRGGQLHQPLAGRTLAMIFEKSSTRTRVSFEVGMVQLGGHALYMSGSDLQLGRGETVADTAKVLSRYVQGIMIRTFHQSMVEELAEHSRVPVVNGLTDLHHPCQALADLQTLAERFGRLKGLRLTYVGDGNNVAHSLMIGGAKVGVHIRVACPADYAPDPRVVALCRKEGARSGSRIEIVHKAAGSVKGADAVYTDVWTSMGQEKEKARRLKAFKGFQVDERLMAESPKAVFLHCLPAHRGEEVSAGVMDGKRSLVFDQAENRLHAQKALLTTLMGTL